MKNVAKWNPLEDLAVVGVDKPSMKFNVVKVILENNVLKPQVVDIIENPSYKKMHQLFKEGYILQQIWN